jgi:hypothetical protein
MKIKKYNESDETLTWNKIIHDKNVDFISHDEKITDIDDRKEIISDLNLEDILSFQKGWGVRTFRNIKVCHHYGSDLFLVFKNEELFAVISGVYETHGYSVFKDIIIIYGHESILLYDIQDFTFKYIHTR